MTTTQQPRPETDTPDEEPTLRKGQRNPFVHSLLVQARELAEEKEALYKRMGHNRNILREIKGTGLLSKEQGKAIDEFYPERQVKAKDETPATTPPAAAAA